MLLSHFNPASTLLLNSSIDSAVNQVFQPLVKILDKVLFWDPFASLGIDMGTKVPFIVIWLIVSAVFFTIYLKFINFKGFRHAIDLVTGKFDKDSHKGEISHFQALATATASTVGLGNIAGVAVAISMGGPGATFWLIVAGLLGMTTKFTECTLGVKFRTVNEDGSVSGGPMYYLKNGLASIGKARTGKVLSILFAIMASIGAFGIGNMFQSNQLILQTVTTFPSLQGNEIYLGVIVALLVGLVIMGGIKGIAKVNDKLFPVMAILYIVSALTIIVVNYKNLGTALISIWEGAFHPHAAFGGFLGVMIMGFRRAAFSNEAGIGSAAIAHSAVKTERPVTEGFVSLLEPFIDTVVICTLTALTIIITGTYQNSEGLAGTQITSAAFATVSPWFSYLLLPSIIMFAYSTIISWSYYGTKSFDFLAGSFFERKFGNRKAASRSYQIIYLIFTVIGAVVSLGAVVDFSDMLILAMALPNILGLYLLAPVVKTELNNYLKELKNKNVN